MAALALVGAVGAAESAAAPSKLDTAVADAEPFAPDNMDASLPHVKRAGANAVRVYLSWRGTLKNPDAATKPAVMDAANPADPNYEFAGLDSQVFKLKAKGLEPIFNFESAPFWAERTHGGWDGGTNSPDPAEYGLFAKAVALRYSGNFVFQGDRLPRVRYWQAWNEPNHYRHLNPQYEVNKPDGSVPP